jgi:hypothetical protein
MLEFLYPHSVIDVEFGVGTWLATFTKYGTEPAQMLMKRQKPSAALSNVMYTPNR